MPAPGALPPLVAGALAEDERALWHAQPIRHANGIGVWMVMALGTGFGVASLGALHDVMGKTLEGGALRGLLPGLLAVLFLAFSLVLLCWPLLSRRKMRRTHVLVTDRRVLEVVEPLQRGRAPRVRSWPIAECTDLAVARRRGLSATLVLRERLRERKSDGQTVYEWEALHGLARADEALELLTSLREGRAAPTLGEA
jgi:hypothetical protein